MESIVGAVHGDEGFAEIAQRGLTAVAEVLLPSQRPGRARSLIC